MKHLLVATDFSAGASRAVAAAGELARATGAEVTVVHVLGAAGGLTGLAPAGDPEADAARSQIAAELAELQLHSVVATAAVLRGDPVEAILGYARARGCDLLLLGRSAHHPHPGPPPPLGRVAARLAAQSPVPVLLTPAAAPQRR